MTRRLIQIPVLHDNTVWLLVDDGKAIVVDPPELAPVQRALDDEGARLVAILCTHHHADHSGANAALALATGARVFGHGADRARIPALTDEIEPATSFTVGPFSFRVHDVRAHTSGHVAYEGAAPVDVVVRHGHDGEARAIARLAGRRPLFVGDSLFLGGCGRLFEGTAEDLRRVMETYAALDDALLVCCAHEYTAANLAFARHVLPGDEAIAARLAALDDEQGPARSSLPDTLAREKATNPYLRALAPATRRALAEALGVAPDDATVVLGALRAAKDAF